MSLRTRLVLAVLGLVAVVGAVIATVTTIALSSHLHQQLDEQLHDVLGRAIGPREPSQGPAPDLSFVARPGQPIGTLGGYLDAGGEITEAAVSGEPDEKDPAKGRITELTGEQIAALERADIGARPVDVDVPGLGEYRVMAAPAPNGQVLAGLPTAQVSGTIGTLVLVECLVTAGGLIAAGIAAAAVVRLALQPLRRVAATATRVAQLPLSRGEVSLTERVPEPDTDTRTEAGQVGAALNRLLGHVGAALKSRHDSEQRVRRFVADASHELRTPLASIRGYAELTRRGREDIGPDTRHALARIESESTRMTGLVEDLLLLARLDSGRPLSMTDVDVSALLVDAFADARAADTAVSADDRPMDGAAEAAAAASADRPVGGAASAAGEPSAEGSGSDARAAETAPEAADVAEPSAAAPASGHRWVLELPDEPVTVRADRDRLQQVLANVLANARVHTPTGTTVTGRVERPTAAAEHPGGPAGHADAGAVIVIRDDGPGIPPHLLPQVFQRFTRGDSSRSRASGSTGLGLAIVEAVIGAHDGEVSIDSEPGSTTVTITLP